MSKLLIIEDSMVIRKIIKHLAQTELTCQYDFAEDFAQARQLIANNDYFLALADLNLPDAPHGEAIEYTLKQGISTVVLTARFSEELRDEMINLGVLDYIYKDNRDSYLQALKLVNQLILNKKTKVLVVDDSRILRNYIKAQCEKLLYPVIEVADGIEALAALREQPDIGLLITDYNMPNMDGLKLIKQIRQTRSRDDFPIIALSSSSDPTLSARFIKQGANDFLVTPFIQEEFQWRILKTMEQIALIQRIRDAANRDYLTNLYNRRYFFNEGGKKYEQALDNRTNLTVALLDIDFFKINLGHIDKKI
ncbi:MAG: response regulator [Psychrobium sp.]|nr:response regulator [Psychrobium sp.]